MHGNCRALLVAVMLYALVGCEKEVSKQAAIPIENADLVENVDVEGLLSSFRATFNANFDIVGARIVTSGRNQEPWCLVSVRPRRAGHFVIRYDVKHVSPLEPEGETWIHEYHLMIGAKGERRYCAAGYAWPLACVGDTIVLSLRVHPAFSEHRFFAHGLDPRQDSAAAERDRQMAQEYPPRPHQYPVVVRNEVEDRLELLWSGARSGASRGGHFLGHGFIGLLEAKEAGRFNVLLGPNSWADASPPRSLAVAVAAKDKAIVLPANRCYVTKTDGTHSSMGTYQWTPDALVLRVGDRFAIGWHYRTDVERRSDLRLPLRDIIPAHPELELTEEAFQPGEGAPFSTELPSPVHE